jgi:predicted neutral ceramidase superfamily lipid hydrolase
MTENQNPTDPQPPQDEIADYYDGVKKLELEGYETGIKKARNALFVAAFLVLLGEVISVAGAGVPFTPLMAVILAVEVGLFIGLALWTKTKPYTAIICGIILMVIYWGLAIWANGTESAFRGILVRVIIIGILISALKSAKAWEDSKKSS